MRGKLIFGAGVGIGYVLGTRAGRERFDQISSKAKQIWENDTVQEAAATMQEQAGRLYDGGRRMMTEQAHKMREHRHDKHDKQSRRREFADRNRKETDWGSPVGYPANSAGQTTMTQY